jgi:hypothetical protein
MLISETHFTNRSFFRLTDYKIYDSKHPDGTAHGGTAVIIRSSIKHHEVDKVSQIYMQATSVVVEDWSGAITFSAIYCPPNKSIKMPQFE